MIEPATTLEEFERRAHEADAELLRFLRDETDHDGAGLARAAGGEGPYVLPADRDPANTGPFDRADQASLLPSKRRTAIRVRCALTTCPATCSTS